ncbi:MAG: S9 family peptidase [Pseudoflavonifractor sp.]|nr:S9 family peptidase [Alloprevotella sp.]MCM1116904.1 S9 family peptidase [Pseudoflavonifractor sp.]
MRRLISLALAALITLPAIIAANNFAPNNKNRFADIERYIGGDRPSYPARFNYLPDGKEYMQLSADGKRLMKFDTRTGKETATIMDLDNTRETTISHIDGYKVSDDGGRVLVWRDSRPIYRRSFDAEYFVYEVRSRILKPLSTAIPRQRAPLFSPDGRMIAFVGPDNNIYIKKLDYWTELPVTTDGKVNEVINGVPDWVYEEEFTTSSSMTWSPDNLNLCFIRYEEARVPMFSFPLYEGACHPNIEYALYPGDFTYKYPVAGEPNSIASVHSYDVETRKTKKIALSDSKIEYIPRITYAFSPERLMIVTLNREQTRMEIYSANPKTTVVKSILVEESNAWLSTPTYEDIHWYPTNFVIQSGRSGYEHLYQYAYSGALEKQITSGDFDVTDYYGFDPVHKCHYIQSTSSGPINRVVSRIDAKGKMTDISKAQGTSSAIFSPDFAFYTLYYSSVDTPPTATLINASSDKTVKTLEENAAYASRWAATPKKEFFTMQSDGVTLNGWMIKPADFNPTKHYPVVMYQYSGPGSQEVLNRWGIGWADYFATQGYIIICVDGRGTGGRGRDFMTIVYKNLGHYESIDQVNAAKYAATLPFVDPSRIGLFGWSFGGYETLMASSQPDAPYAAAVAVAPVTDWRYYDTIYAERYMLTPQMNPDGYRDSAPINRADKVKCPLLIMHGTADDNVHFSNAVEYVAHLQAAGGWCDMYIFPNMNHSINGCGMQAVVYARMLDYFNQNMK